MKALICLLLSAVVSAAAEDHLWDQSPQLHKVKIHVG
jgi:hypothetical protein